MTVWRVDVSDSAKDDLRGIYQYIAQVLIEPVTARKKTDRIRTAIRKLDQMPKRFPLYDREPWASRGMRRMDVGNYCVFYVPDDQTNIVTIIRIMYARRDVPNLL